MPAVYGVRYTCDNCGAVADVWQPDGNHPGIGRNIPDGWKQSAYAHGAIKPLWQRPIVCPACRPALVAWEEERNEWSRRHGEAYRAAHAPAYAADEAWAKANPQPTRPPPLARLNGGGTMADPRPEHLDEARALPYWGLWGCPVCEAPAGQPCHRRNSAKAWALKHPHIQRAEGITALASAILEIRRLRELLQAPHQSEKP